MKIEILPIALRELANLPLPQRQLVDEHILSLADNPRPEGVKVLSEAKQLLRWQQSDYSIVYQLQDQQSIVVIVKITYQQN